MLIASAKNAWRQRGYEDADAGRVQRAPLRDDGGEAYAAYMEGYRAAARKHGKRLSPAT